MPRALKLIALTVAMSCIGYLACGRIGQYVMSGFSRTVSGVQYVVSGFSQTVFAQSPEVRAMWVQRGSLASPRTVLSVVETAKDGGFNTLIVQVRGRGDAFYISRQEPRPPLLANQPATFDPLELMVTTAHRAGLKVHAWINVNLVSDARPPASRRHIVHTHPEWLMVPRSLAPDLMRMSPKRPEYLRRLSEYARAHSDRVEGIFASPIHKDAAEHVVRVIGDIAGRYDLDGIHLDYIRFPNDEFDYSAETLNAFRSSVTSSMSAAERRDYASRARGRPFFYTEMFPQRWQEFRRARLTELLTRIRSIVKSRRSNTVLSAAVFPDAGEASTHRFQDWGTWLDSGLLDAICPMAYTTDPALFRSQIANVKQRAGTRPVWAGIGAYQLSPRATVENIRTARQLGVDGVVLFSYDNLNAAYVTTVSKGAFAQ